MLRIISNSNVEIHLIDALLNDVDRLGLLLLDSPELQQQFEHKGAHHWVFVHRLVKR